MISHQFEERMLGVLSIIGSLFIVAAIVYLICMFGSAWRRRDVVDMVGWGYVLIMLAIGSRSRK